MLNQFQTHIKRNDLFSTRAKILLAVSGGVDSVVMTHLFKKAGYEFGIAHCNFKLRAEAADKDELLCKNLAETLDVPFFSIAFETRAVARKRGVSIQMAARDLRYDWFKELSVLMGYNYVATAHHLNDSIETVLFNFAKGCGLRGLHGIPVKNGDTVRPLLFATRRTIENYAKEYKITYREDASNAETKYARNKIRHEVIPSLQKINTVFEASAGKTIQRIQEAEVLFDFAIESLRRQWLKKVNEVVVIEFSVLKTHAAVQTILFEFLREYNFNADQVSKIIAKNTQSGAIFYSVSHRLLVDREELLIAPLLKEEKVIDVTISDNENRVVVGEGVLLLDKKNGYPESFSSEKNIAYLDIDKLNFPLKVRRWRAGDIFQPMGMNGQSKKLKDFFTDNKVSRFEKEKVLILEARDGEIIWIIGHRTDERFKISTATQRYVVACYFITNVSGVIIDIFES